MLDSLGSTLSKETIDVFFTKHNKDPQEGEVTVNEAIQCLEEELCRPPSMKKRISFDENGAPDTSTAATPMLLNTMSGDGNGISAPSLGLENLNFSGAAAHPTAVEKGALIEEPEDKQTIPAHPTEPSQQTLRKASLTVPDSSSSSLIPTGNNTEKGLLDNSDFSTPSPSVPTSDAEDSSGNSSEEPFERVINVKNCPLCHKPRMNSKAEVDIVTHLAVCASQDWARVDRIVVDNFVTASQAQRKWYTKVITKVSAGNYKIGAVRNLTS